MTRLIFITFFWLLLFCHAFAQKYKSVLEKRFDLNLLLIKQKLVADSLTEVHGYNLDEVNKILSDTSFIKPVIESSSHDHDQLVCSAYKIPNIIRPLGWISDYGHIFTDSQTTTLNSTLTAYEKRTTNEIAVVTFDSSFIQDQNFDSLVLAIHNFWGVGKMGKDNGILIAISTAKRRIRISNGYGIEDKLSDEETKAIIDNVIVPAFRKGDYFDGIQNAIEEIIKKL